MKKKYKNKISEVQFIRKTTGAERILALELSLKLVKEENLRLNKKLKSELQFAECVKHHESVEKELKRRNEELMNENEKFAQQTTEFEIRIEEIVKSHKEEIDMLHVVINNYEEMQATEGGLFDGVIPDLDFIDIPDLEVLVPPDRNEESIADDGAMEIDADVEDNNELFEMP